MWRRRGLSIAPVRFSAALLALSVCPIVTALLQATHPASPYSRFARVGANKSPHKPAFTSYTLFSFSSSALSLLQGKQ